MATQPDLGIENPYALDQEQLDAAKELLLQQKELVGEYWSDYTKTLQSFKQRRHPDRNDLADHQEPGW